MLNMGKIREYKGIIILILAVLAGAFYWYEWRPTQIRKECNQKSYNIAQGYSVVYDTLYVGCLSEKGLQK